MRKGTPKAFRSGVLVVTVSLAWSIGACGGSDSGAPAEGQPDGSAGNAGAGGSGTGMVGTTTNSSSSVSTTTSSSPTGVGTGSGGIPCRDGGQGGLGGAGGRDGRSCSRPVCPNDADAAGIFAGDASACPQPNGLCCSKLCCLIGIE